MSLRMQAMLLRFLENGEIQAVGSDTRQSTVDVRVIAATNRNLPDLIAAGQFREDLLYRLRVIHLEVPPLRLRRDEIPVLVNHFITRTHRRASFTADAMEALCRYRWPGNVRELQNVVEQAMWLSHGDLVDVAQLPEILRVPAQPVRPTRERRVQVADELYAALVNGGYSFWDHIYPLFLSRDITRHDMRELVRKGLSTTRGNYRQLLKLFGMANQDYKRFLNFLAAHDCGADFRAFRHGTAEAERPPRLILPPLACKGDAAQRSRNHSPQQARAHSGCRFLSCFCLPRRCLPITVRKRFRAGFVEDGECSHTAGTLADSLQRNGNCAADPLRSRLCLDGRY
jgi:hypothetical protein